MKTEFKSGMKYTCRHVPTGEEWVVIGISIDLRTVCAAGYPPSMANLSDCTGFKEAGTLNEQEIVHRRRHFGTNWI